MESIYDSNDKNIFQKYTFIDTPSNIRFILQIIKINFSLESIFNSIKL